MRWFSCFLWIVLVCTVDSKTEVKSLECFVTKNVIYDEKPKYTLEGGYTETIEYNKTDELKTGPPTCIIFYGTNETHSGTWQGHVSSFALPLECHINSESYTHCFNSPNKFTFLPLSTGWLCCCSYDKCNTENPSFFHFFEKNVLDTSPLLNQLKPVARYSFCILACGIVIALEALLEVLCWKMCGKQKKSTCDMVAEESGDEKEKAKRKEVVGRSPADPLKSPLLPSSLKVQATQSSPPSKVNSNKPNSEMTIRPDSSSLKLDPTQEDELKESPLLEVASTQRGEDPPSDDVVPIPEKPAFKVTKTGRIQKTSMNYEESTYSDLQDD